MSRIVIRRVTISEVREGNIKRFDATGMDGEPFNNRECFQQFGFTSRSRGGTEGILVGSGNMYFLISSDDRDNRPATENAGDSFLYTDKNNYVEVKASGEVLAKSTVKVKADAPIVELGNGTLRKLIDERIVEKLNSFITTEYRPHTHPTAAVGPPSVPSNPGTAIVLADVSTEKTTAS